MKHKNIYIDLTTKTYGDCDDLYVCQPSVIARDDGDLAANAQKYGVRFENFTPFAGWIADQSLLWVDATTGTYGDARDVGIIRLIINGLSDEEIGDAAESMVTAICGSDEIDPWKATVPLCPFFLCRE